MTKILENCWILGCWDVVPECFPFFYVFFYVSGDCKNQLFVSPNFFLQKFSIFWKRKIIYYIHIMFILVYMVSEHVDLEIIFGTFEIISVHNFWNFKNRAKNKLKNKKVSKWKSSKH